MQGESFDTERVERLARWLYERDGDQVFHIATIAAAALIVGSL